MKENNKTCRMKGCKRPVYIEKHKLCSAHYQRFRRFGDPGEGKIREYRDLSVGKKK